MELSNALIYGNRLRCGSSEIADAKLEYLSNEPVALWLKEVNLSYKYLRSVLKLYVYSLYIMLLLCSIFPFIVGLNDACSKNLNI